MLFRPDRRLTLDSFFPRMGNQRARAAGIQFIGAQQAQPDTLIVVGRQGSGKSHLLHALANYAKKNEVIHSIACMTAVHFDRIFYQPVIADALLAVMRLRQNRRRRTLLAVTMNQAPPVQTPLTDFMDSQPAVRLI